MSIFGSISKAVKGVVKGAASTVLGKAASSLVVKYAACLVGGPAAGILGAVAAKFVAGKVAGEKNPLSNLSSLVPSLVSPSLAKIGLPAEVGNHLDLLRNAGKASHGDVVGQWIMPQLEKGLKGTVAGEISHLVGGIEGKIGEVCAKAGLGGAFHTLEPIVIKPLFQDVAEDATAKVFGGMTGEFSHLQQSLFSTIEHLGEDAVKQALVQL